MRAAWEEFQAMTDPVSVFLAQQTIVAANAWVTKADLLGAYNTDCDKHGRAGLTARAFGLALKRAMPKVEETQKTRGDRRVWCYTGIGLKSDNDPDGGRGGGGSPPTPDARDARDYTNVNSALDTPHRGETLHKQDESGKNRGEYSEITSKGNRVHPVHRVHFGSGEELGYGSVAEFFATPPEWLPKQLAIYRQDPDRHFRPLCSTVAAVVLGDPLRGEEVAEEVRKQVSG